MTKIRAEHLARSACVYIRQSTADQLLHNHESRRRQYALADRARQFGWRDVVVIDDDLEAVVHRLQQIEPDPSKIGVIEASRDYDQVEEIWELD